MFDPYVGYQAIAIEYITDPTDPDYKKNRVKLLINQTQNDRKKDGTSAHDPLNPELITNPTLVQTADGLYIKDASEDNFGATIYATRNVAQYLTDGTGDEVLDPTAANIRKTVKPLDILDFVKYSKSVDPSLKYLYEKDTTTHEHLNKTMIDAFNEIASVKIDTQHIKSSLSATDEEKATYIEAYRLYTTPDASTTTKNFLGDKIYDYRSIVPTSTLKADAAGPFYPSQVNDYTLYYLNQREAKGTTPETYDEVGFYLWSAATGFFPVGGKDIRGKEAIGVEYITDDSINEVSLIINEYKNDENLVVNPDGSLTSNNPVLIQKQDEDGHDGLYVAHAYRAEVDPTDPSTVVPRQWGVTTFASEDQVLAAEEKNLAVSPLDLHTFVNDSESVNDDFRPGDLYEDGVSHERLNKTLVSAFNELASIKAVDTRMLSDDPLTTPSIKEKAIYNAKYELWTLPDEAQAELHHMLGDMIYDYRSIVQTETLIPNPAGPFYPEQVNNYTLYYHSKREVIEEVECPVGVYMWRNTDPTDPTVGEFFLVHSNPIITVKTLPESEYIQDEFFYRVYNNYTIDKRYALTDNIKREGGVVETSGYHAPDGTFTSWADFDLAARIADDTIEEVPTKGDIFVVTDHNVDPAVTSIVYNFNSTPITLQFRDAVQNKWVDLISKYNATSDLATITEPTEWELYIQLNDTDDYDAGLYIWDGGDFVLVASNGMPIIDTDAYPEVDIEANSFYRKHNHYVIENRYSLTHDAKLNGFTIDEGGLWDSDHNCIPWTEASLVDLVTAGTLEENPEGEIFRVLDNDVDPPTSSTRYQFNSTPVELTFWDPENEIWVDMISKYHALPELNTIPTEDRREWEIYVQLSNTVNRKAGAYIWDGAKYVSISSQTDAIIDADELPDVDIENNLFYRLHYNYEINNRYALTEQAKKDKWRLVPAGIVKPDLDIIPWTDVDLQALLDDSTIEEKADGEIFKVTDAEGEFVAYNFNSSPVTLQFHDVDTDTWVDVISKYQAVNDITSITDPQEWELYVQLNDTEDYKAGIYIWDRNDFVSISSKTEVIIDVDELPEIDIEENSFYRMIMASKIKLDDEGNAEQYKLKDEAKNSYILLPEGLYKIGSATDFHTWQEVNGDWDSYSASFERAENGDLVRIVTSAEGEPETTTLVYKYYEPTVELKYHDAPNDRWVNINAPYEVVFDLDSASKHDTTLYIFTTNITKDNKFYGVGTYYWSNAIKDYVKVEQGAIKYGYNVDDTTVEMGKDNFILQGYDNAVTVHEIYKLSTEALEAGWKYTNTGIDNPDGEIQLKWQDHEDTYGTRLAELIADGTIVADSKNGEIFIVSQTNGPTINAKVLLRGYVDNDVKLNFYDQVRSRWIDTLHNYQAIYDFKEVTTPNEYMIYTLLKKCEWSHIEGGTPDVYEPGVYIWNGLDYTLVGNVSNGIIDVDKYPVLDINGNSFYRKHNGYNIVTRYDIKEEKILDGWKATPEGLYQGEELKSNWADFDPANYAEVVEENEAGTIFKVEADGETTYAYNFNSTPVELRFFDEVTNTWVDVISKYNAVNDITKIENPQEWELYVQLNDTDDYKAGIYIWDRNDFVSISSKTEVIIDVDELPQVNIEGNSFYRRHNDYTVNKRYSLKEEATEAGWKATPDGLYLGEELKCTWADFDPANYEDQLEESTTGPIFELEIDGETSYAYNWNSSPVELQFYDEENDTWVDLISKYKAVNNLADIAEPQEWEIYIQLEDSILYKTGIYIWDGNQFVAVSSKSDSPIYDVIELPDTDIKDGFYRLHKVSDVAKNDEGQVLRYKLNTEDYKLTNNGLLKVDDGTIISYATVLAQWDSFKTLFTRSDDGLLYDIIKDTTAETPEHELVYRYHENRTKVYMRDPSNGDWIETVPGYKLMNTFEGQTGNDYTLYVLAEGYGEYEQGTYYWDGNEFVNTNGKSQVIIEVDELPEDPLGAFYLTHNDLTYTGNTYKLTDAAVEAGYVIKPEQGIETPDHEVKAWGTFEPSTSDFLEAVAADAEEGPVKEMSNADSELRAYYNYIVTPYQLQFSDGDKWRDISTVYIPITKGVANIYDATNPKLCCTNKLYAFLEDYYDAAGDKEYKAGLYAYNGVKYIPISSNGGGIINCTELPENPQITSIYELYTENEATEFKKYKFNDASSTIDIFGIHVVDPVTSEETITCWADVFRDWATWESKFLEAADDQFVVVEYERNGATIREYRTTLPVFPENNVQFWVYNETTEEWYCLDDSSNSINGVYNYDIGEQDSDTLGITWEGSQAEYEALTSINSKTIYFVWDGEGIPGPKMSYNALVDRPSINDVLLQGNMTLQELGIQAFLFKGEVPTQTDLPTEDNVVGDVYSVVDEGALYAWDGIKWDKISDYLLDLNEYQKKHDDDLETTAKEVVPAINEILATFGKPEKVTFTLAGGRTGSSLGTCSGIYNPSSKTAVVSIEITNLGIDTEGTYNLGQITMKAKDTGVITPVVYQSLTAVDGDIFSDIDNEFCTTNAGIDADGNIKIRTIVGASSVTSSGTYKINPNELQTINLTATIFVTTV